MKSKNNQTIEVTIEKIVPGGQGLAFADKMTVFVALAAPGDLLRVRVREKKGKVAFCEIVEILEPSPLRHVPPCPYFGICGGCDFQQLTYAAQLEAKTAIVRDCLERIGKINYEREIPIVRSPDDLNYRVRAQWHLDTRRRRLGYFRRQSHEVIDVEICPILAPPLKAKLAELRAHLNPEEFWAERAEIDAATGAHDSVSIFSSEIVEPTEEIYFAAAGERYFFDARSFFQGNRFLIDDLIRLALEDAGGEAALDLFCGVGLFTLPLARRFVKVFGVEASAEAVDHARKNAERARLSNIEFFAEDVSRWLAENALQAKPDFVLLDPPRAGAEKKTVESLLEIKPREISYVSCDPATLARDLKKLAGSYSIEKITAVDLFPQTHHVETVVRLRLESPSL
jgi:23S rRNA (uracil1939-C5)-methyltransferase